MYKYMNVNPDGNNIEDCTIRAISVAEGISWDEAYNKLSKSARKLRLMMSSVDAIEEYLDMHYDRVRLYEDTVGEFIENHPYGIYLITMKRTHYSSQKSERIMTLLTRANEKYFLLGKYRDKYTGNDCKCRMCEL